MPLSTDEKNAITIEGVILSVKDKARKNPLLAIGVVTLIAIGIYYYFKSKK